MFKACRNRIDSDEGFSVEFTRMDLVYSDGSGTIRLNHELGPKRKMIALWRRSLEELNPDEELSQEDRDQIIDRVRRAFEAVDYDVTII